jgi:DNA gyrase inhibitor GyrI
MGGGMKEKSNLEPTWVELFREWLKEEKMGCYNENQFPNL